MCSLLILDVREFVCWCVSFCVHVIMHGCMHGYVYIYNMYLCAYLYIYIFMYVGVHVCVCMGIHDVYVVNVCLCILYTYVCLGVCM